MKQWILFAAICSMPLTMMAQDDDMYFVPTKENVEKEAERYGLPSNTYYSGSDRSVDNYNGRLSTTITPLDSTGRAIEGEDYQYTRRLSRFDDYSPSAAYWEGYRDGRWMSPWYYGHYYSWYDPWYDPWYYGSYYYGYYGYYGGYYSWSYPWRYGWYSSYYRPWRYYGWGTPYYYGRTHYRSYSSPGLSRSLRYYDRNNYYNNGTRRTVGGGRISSQSGRVGSGYRGSSYSTSGNSGFRSSSGNSGFRSSSSGGGGFRSGSSGGGSRGGGGGGRVGGGRR